MSGMKGKKREIGLKQVDMIIAAVENTDDDEINCEEAYRHFDEYAEIIRQHKETPAVLRKVEAHLSRCMECGEEFRLLLRALEATD